jgi:hypothetical protein
MMLEEFVPDLAAYSDAWINLGIAQRNKLLVEKEYDALKAEILDTVTSNREYFVRGKPPSVTHSEKTYLVMGYDTETKNLLESYRTKLAELEKEITHYKGIVKAEEMKLSVFQTMSANARNTVSLND